MLKRIFRATRVTAVVLMVLSIMSPLQVAEATGTISKEITVLGLDGNPYVGALVSMNFRSTVGSSQTTNATQGVLTDSSGKALVTFSDALTNGVVNVQPPATDTTTAIYTTPYEDNANGAPLTVNLRRAQVRINIKTFDGQPAPAYGGVRNGYQEWYWYIRSGDANISFPLDAANNTCTKFNIYAADEAIGSYRRFYASKITGSGETRTATLYNDPGTCLVEVPKVNGVYQLKHNAGNISGNLLSNSNQPLSFATNQGYEVQQYAVNSNGTINSNIPAAFSYVRSDGSWDSYVDTATAGKYELVFTGYGNPNYPSFKRNYFWVTSDHKLSWSADGSGASDALNGNISIPLPNVKFSFIDSATGLNIPVNVEMSRKVDGTSSFADTTNWDYLDGAPSFFAADGDYQLKFARNYGGGNIQLNFTVTGGIATLTSSSTSNYSYSNGVYKVWLPFSNARLYLKDSTNSAVQGYAHFCLDGGNCTTLNADSSGLLNGFLADGTYTNIFVYPGNDLNISGQMLSGSVTNGVLALIGKTAVDRTFMIQMASANIKFNAIHPTTLNPVSSGWISLERADSNWNSTGWLGNANILSSPAGFARAYLPDGRYLAVVNVQTTNGANPGLASKIYRIVMSNGVPTVSDNGANISAVDGKFTVPLALANLEITVKNLAGIAITDGQVDICPDLGSGKTGPCRGYGLYNSGQITHALANGNWTLFVRPGSSTGMSSKSYSVSVVDGVATITGASKTDGRWILTGITPNIFGTFSLSIGSLTFANNQGISLSVQKYNNGKWDWQNGGSWIRTPNYNYSVTDQGRYRLVATPQNFSDLVQSYSSEFWVNESAKLSVSETGTYTDSITAVNIRIEVPNLKLKVLNPLDNTLLPGGWVSIQKINGNQRDWVGSGNIFSSNPGLTGASISEAGEYILTVTPPNGSNAIVGLASREYQLHVNSVESMTVSFNGSPVSFENGRFVLSPAAANVTARIMKSDGTPFGNGPGLWVNVNLQKYNADQGYWDWTNTWAQTDQDGYVSMRAESAGTYRLRIEPSGDPDATISYSSEFTVTSQELSTFKKDFGSITLAAPSIRISVATPSDSATAIEWANIEIRKDGNWLDWANTNQSGIAGISLKSAGAYEFVVHPSYELQGTNSRKSYKVTATANSEGVVTASVVSGAGVSVANNVTTLLLGTPTLTGTVLAPSPSTTGISNSQVYAYNVSSGQEMWEYSTNTNQSGAWAMTLPAGTYKIFARAPWGSATYGGSDGVGEVVVNSSGVATTVPAGQSSSALTIRLKTPTWTGVVKNPAGSAVVPNARICLRLSNIWNCVNADNNGAWALSAPSNFTSFTGTNPYLEINDDFGRQYPQKRFDGESAVNAAIGTSGSNIVLQFANANTQITVTAGGNPVANVWVSAERDGAGWLGGGSTNANGVAKLTIIDPSVEFKVRVELNGNPSVSSAYASTMKTFTASQISSGTSAGVFSGSVALSEPNFKVALLEPTSDGSVGNVVPYAWIELYSDTTGNWLGGSSTDANGFASFKLDVPQSGINNFTVTVNPAWNASTDYSRQAYAVAVSSSSITVVNKTTTNAVSISDVSGRDVYPLRLSMPSVTGVVVDPSGNNVANSWVVPREVSTNEYLWQSGVNSRNNGAIALSLKDREYTLEANVPWGSSNVAKSAQCSVTVLNGTISTGGACIQNGATKTVRLALRAPNVTFTLKIGGVAVANANVGIGSGKWYTNAQSDSEGKVALFIDAPAIRAMNSYTTAQPLYVWVDPPYGSSVEMARWDCSSTQSKPICTGLVNVPATGDYPTTSLGDVTGVTPNTRIHVVAPNTSTSLPNSWVGVFAFDPSTPSNGRRWLGGGNSNGSGYVSMNLETSTVPSSWRFAVEINAPWNQRQLYATNMDTRSGSGYTWAQLINLPDMSPKSPNLTLTVNTSNALANKFGWIAVEKVSLVNGIDTFQEWVGGYGLNENGISSIFLAASGRYRVTSYPGPGKSGARTTCILSTDGSEVVSRVSGKCDAGSLNGAAITIGLDGGNIVGLVTRASDSQPLVGAIVYANQPDAVDESNAVITSTNADGRYGLQLDPTKTWDIKVFPTGVGSTSLRVTSKTGITPPQSGSASHNISVTAA